MKGLKPLIDSTCEQEFQDVMRSPLFDEVPQLFLLYLHHLCHSNRKLLKFQMSCVGIVEVVLELIRQMREGNQYMQLSFLRGIVPWCFPYDNVNHARYLSAYLSEMSHVFWRSTMTHLSI